MKGFVRFDGDGCGSSHLDSDHQNGTSYGPRGHPLNADTASYVVVSYENKWTHGIAPGDRATITADRRPINAIVGDVGPNGIRNLGEISIRAAQLLGLRIRDVRNLGPCHSASV